MLKNYKFALEGNKSKWSPLQKSLRNADLDDPTSGSCFVGWRAYCAQAHIKYGGLLFRLTVPTEQDVHFSVNTIILLET
jgi:hypothetical protein